MARGIYIVVPVLVLALVASSMAQQENPHRRVRVRTRPLQPAPTPQPIELEPQAQAPAAPEVQYYAVQTEEEIEEPQAVVVVQRPPRVRAQQPLFGNQLASRADEQEYRPSTRPLGRAVAQQQHPRTKEHTKAPPVQTIRNYNNINDDGSFTFGYEAADGSFKEETRGTDCVVRGKYGYIDPDGNKREFTYVSGNPCDPNNPDPEEDERPQDEDDSEENIPAVRPNLVRRPVSQQRVRPAQPQQPAVSVFQNNYVHGQRVAPSNEQIPITPRPSNHLRTFQATRAPEATTYRPEIQNYPATLPVARQQTFVTASPAPFVTTRVTPASPTASSINFDEELKKFQIEAGAPVRTVTPTPPTKNFRASANVIPTTLAARPTPAAPQPILRTSQEPRPAGPPTAINPYYSSQLVYDPASGQYNTVLYQNLPKGGGDFSLNHRLQAFVPPQQPQPTQSAYLSPPAAPQTFYHQQQPAAAFSPAHAQRAGPVQFQPSRSAAPTSAPLAPASTSPFAHPQPYSRPTVSNDAQSFYYINPNLRNQFSTGQIDAFLRGHNVQF